MDNEKELLKQDLAKQETKKDIEAFIEDTEIMGGHEDIVALAKAKLENIDVKVIEVNTPIPPVEATNTKVEAMNGSSEVVQEKTVEVDTKLTQNAEEIIEVKTESAKEIEEVKGVESKETKQEFSENYILNPKLLDKIAQMEAIHPETLEFDQQRYDDYINGQAKLGNYSVGVNQNKVRDALATGKSIRRARTEPIYGQGGWNRYGIDGESGEVKLLRGVSNTSGSEEYKIKLAEKAKELGFKVE
ncbi:MAG: hypothetical protein NT068_04095 [Candidatus Nomurabacteria bacterium]|nr:hypothetical protein [Candidatus Nomurabacteria bacterium]